MTSKKEGFLAFLTILILLFIFYPDLFLAKAASLMGDHLEQHYPWTYLLAKSIKNFQFPWWTELIHCGFPIIAEGQVGAFYLPNLILCFLFPIHWAYAYMNVVHFLISGCATYFYGRFMGLNVLSSFLATFIFLFGSGFGGAYYNIISLKTIAWFPVSLFLFEHFYKTGKFRYIALLSVALAFCLIAGYLQVASLALLVFILYITLRILVFTDLGNHTIEQKIKKVGLILLSIGFSFILAFPQLFLTFQLAFLSSRAELAESYAYIGSLSPLALLTLFFTEIQSLSRGNSLYGGVLILFFILCAVFHSASCKSQLFKIWVWVGFISFFLALGGWSPLYVGLVKLTRFYSFRMPAKFLVFICFALAILAGIGFQALQNSMRSRSDPSFIHRAVKNYLGVLFIGILGYGFLYFFVTEGRPFAIQAGQWFVEKFVYGKVGHPHSLQVYHGKLMASLDSIKSILSFENLWNQWNYGLLGLGTIFVVFLRRLKKSNWVWLWGVLLFFFVDLYVFAWRDIKRDFDTFEQLERPSKIITYLKAEQAHGRLGRIHGIRGPEESLPIVPSKNILHGFEDIGVYSPLVMKRYHETIGQLGGINDSNFAFTPTVQFLKEHMGLLNFLDVSHILSTHPLPLPGLQFLIKEEGTEVFLYKNQNTRGRSLFISNVEVFKSWEALRSKLLEVGFDPTDTLLLENSEYAKLDRIFPKGRKDSSANLRRISGTSNQTSWEVITNGPGFFVLSHIFYPGWKATLNGMAVPILKAYGLFQAIWIPEAGTYQVELRYRPFHFL